MRYVGVFIAGWLVSVAQGLGAQQPRHDIAGVVVSEGGGGPVSRAVISLDGGTRSAVTDDRGAFVLRGVRAGPHHLHATAAGHAPAVVVVEVPGDGASGVTIALRPTPLSLPGLEVTARPGGGDVRGVAQATTQLSGSALERRLAGTLAATLEREPGVAVRYAGPAAAAPMLRGLSGDRIVILEDGQRAGDLSGSAADHGVTVDPLSARRIEVVRGPASLLYGSNALGGVVNVVSGEIPLEAPSEANGEATLQVESVTSGVAASAHGEAPLGERWGVSVRLGAREAGDVRVPEGAGVGGRLANSGLSSRHAAVGLGYAGAGVRAGGAVRAYSFRYGLPVRPGAAPMRWDGRRVEVSARGEADLPVSRFPRARLDATVQDYAHDEREAGGGAGNRFELRTATAGLLVDQAEAGVFGRGAWGVSGLWKEYRGEGTSSLTPPAVSHAIGIFGFQELRLGESGVALQVGARLDRYAILSRDDAKFGPGRERVFGALSGSAGVVVPVGERLTAAFTLARAFRAPTVEELFSSSLHAGTGAVEFGNPDLDAERSLGIDAVLRLHGPRVSGQVAAYRNAITGYVHPAVLGDTIVDGHALPVVTYAASDATLTGVEGALEVAATGNLVIGFGGDVVHAERADGGTLPFLPPARLLASLRWDDGARFVGGGVRHATARRRISEGDETPTDGYTLFDLEAGIRLLRGGSLHSLTLRVENAADTVYRDATSRIKDFAPNPGRNFALLYRVRI
jgi:iron complex outermembrane receptor protein